MTLASAAATMAALAACSPDAPNPVAPRPSASVAAAPASAAGRYILVSNSGFPSDLGTQIAALGGTVERVHAGAGVAVVTGISDANASQLASIKGVSDVEPDAVVALDNPVAASAQQAPFAADAIASQGNPATALLARYQWNMYLIGADKAWAAGKLGSSSVTVAIIDTGIDYDAYDLNGLVDVSRSASFVPTDDALEAQYFPQFAGRLSISDLNGHGTNVATQVSSKALVFAGVTSKTRLMAVKVLGADGRGSISAVLSGVLWAADHGADVANMSLGGDFAKAGNGRYVGLINRIFNYAARKGVLVVVAAGNAASDLDHDGNSDPTYCSSPQVVCVSAVGPATATASPDSPASYTNYGRSAISVAAPGGDYTLTPDGHLAFASWVYSLCSKTTLTLVDPAKGTFAPTLCAIPGRIWYTGDIGTSQATPHVAGLAALLVAEKGAGHPAQIKAAIEQSAIDLGQPGTDPYYGKGRISVSNALGL